MIGWKLVLNSLAIKRSIRRSFKLLKSIFYKHFEVFWWSSNVASKLTSLCLMLMKSSSFFMNLLHSAVFWLFQIWWIIGNSLKYSFNLLNAFSECVPTTPLPLQPKTPPSLSPASLDPDFNRPHHYMWSYYNYQSQPLCLPLPQMLVLMSSLVPVHVFLPKWHSEGIHSISKLWLLISQHFNNRTAISLQD